MYKTMVKSTNLSMMDPLSVGFSVFSVVLRRPVALEFLPSPCEASQIVFFFSVLCRRKIQQRQREIATL
jgi:hypothetical protein